MLYRVPMNMGGRIEQRLKELGWKQVDLLARVPELDAGTLSDLIRRDSKRSEFAARIASAMGVTLLWLLDGKEPKETPTVGTGHQGSTAAPAPPGDARTPLTPAAGIGERARTYAALSAEDEALLTHYHHLTPQQRQEALARMREQAQENLEVLKHLGRKMDQ